jgi:hypothetical protein
MAIIQFSGMIDGVTAKKDRTLSIKLGTQELPPEDTAKIFEHQGQQIFIAIAETAVSREQIDIPEVCSEIDKKSPSERLRGRMAAYYKETKGNFEGFDEWYKKSMEKIGQSYLDKLN